MIITKKIALIAMMLTIVPCKRGESIDIEDAREEKVKKRKGIVSYILGAGLVLLGGGVVYIVHQSLGQSIPDEAFPLPDPYYHEDMTKKRKKVTDELVKAIKSGDIDGVQNILEGSEEYISMLYYTEEDDAKEEPLFVLALKKSNKEIVKYLIEEGGDNNLYKGKYVSALDQVLFLRDEATTPEDRKRYDKLGKELKGMGMTTIYYGAESSSFHEKS